MTREEFGKILISARSKIGVSLAKMAERTQLSASMLSQLERGGIFKPSYDTLLRICKAYGINEREAHQVFFEESRGLETDELAELFSLVFEIFKKKKIMSRKIQKEILKSVLEDVIKENKLEDRGYIIDKTTKLVKQAS